MFPVKRFAGTACVPPANAPKARSPLEIVSKFVSRFALICGRDARGPNNHLKLGDADSASEGIKIPQAEINNNSYGNGGSGDYQTDLRALT